MAGLVTPRDYSTEDTGMRAGDLVEKYNPTSGQNESIDFENWNSEGMYLISGRIAMQESKVVTLTSIGWYDLAIWEISTGFRTANTKLDLCWGGASGRTATCSLQVLAEDSANGLSDSKIRIIDAQNDLLGFTKFRLAGANVQGPGFIIQAYKSDTTTITLSTVKIDNISSDIKGFELSLGTTPNDTPTLPDGVTSATFIEAGAEYTASTLAGSFIIGSFQKLSNDQISCTVRWPNVPKQGTSISLTTPSTAWNIVDGSGTQANLDFSTGTTVSNFTIDNYDVSFRLTKTGAFTTFNTGPLLFKSSGTGGKLTITG